MISVRLNPLTPPSTPFPEDSSEYYGWFSPALQELRVSHPSRHKFNGKMIESPPYLYWTLHGSSGEKVLVTEITHTSIPTPRQVANGYICVGRLDKYWGRSYTRLYGKRT
jgi:hypothetical protein